MVLFNDTLPPKPPTLLSKCLKWSLRVIIFFVIIFGFFVGSLNLLQGNGNTQKRGIEKTIDAFTNRSTNISDLIAFELFPELRIEFKGMKNGLFSDEQINAYSFKLRAPGSSVFTKASVVRDIDIQHLKFIKNGNLIHHISHIYIDQSINAKPQLIIKFDQPKELTIKIGLEGTTHFKIVKDIPFSVEWSNGEINGYIMDTGFITGTGSLKNALSDIKPGEIQCFFGKLEKSEQGFDISNLWIKQPQNELDKVSSLNISPFSSLVFKEQSKQIYSDNIKNSPCASFAQSKE